MNSLRNIFPWIVIILLGGFLVGWLQRDLISTTVTWVLIGGLVALFCAALWFLAYPRRTPEAAGEQQREADLDDSQFTVLMESTLDAMVGVDEAGVIVLANERLWAMFGYATDELLGEPVETLIPESIRQRHVGLRQAYVEDPEARPMGAGLSTVGRKKNGAEFPVEISLSPMSPDQEVLVLATVRDTTRDIEVREQAHLHFAALNAAANGIVITDRKGDVVWANPAFTGLTGYALDEVRGKNTSFLKSGEMPEGFYREMWETISRDEIWTGELVNRRKDGSTYPEEMTITPVKDLGGKILHYIAIKQDITQRRTVEEALRRRTEELARSNHDLDSFAYVASHDLQEPLRMVTSYVQLLERRYADQLDDNAKEFIAYAVDGANRMRQLILDLLDYSRVKTRGKEFKSTDLKQCLEAALSNLSVSIEENGAMITQDPLPTVMADPGQMTRVFQNLISNALKFRREEALEIHIGSEPKNGMWRIHVRDNGIGIGEQYQERIFEIFQRLHNRSTHPGTGIGLAIVKQIIDRHGGTVDVESGPGGSTFSFTLPNSDDT